MLTTRRLGDFSTDPRQLGVLSGLAAVLGVAGAVLAFALLKGIGLITNVAYFGRLGTALVQPSLAHWGLWAALVPVAGGLVVGLIARFGSEKIRGHGIPEALQSILENESLLQARLLLFKPIASAITIGTGGPFGAEGPIIMSGGTLGSVAAQFLALAPIERRILLVAGAAAGMSATFGSPIAAVFLAVELMLFEWRPRSFVPVAIASLVAYGARNVLLGPGPVFPVAHPVAFPVADLPWAAAVGILAGGVSGLLTWFVYAVEDGYKRLPIHWMWWPALGGAVVGLGGLVAPSALGVGYGTIGALVDGRLAVAAVASILVVKAIIWVVSLSSGTSGGVLAPLLLIGGAVGALASVVIPFHAEGVWATIAMAAMLGGTMRAPFTATIFALETTHDWAIVAGIFTACIGATATTVLCVRRSILTERLARRGTHVAREYAVHPLEGLAVGAVMIPRERVEAFDADASVDAARERLYGGDPSRSHNLYPVLDAGGTLCGVVRRGALLANRDEHLPVRRLCEPAVRIHRDERVRHAVELMAKTDHRGLVVVDDRGAWVGFLDQGDVLHAWRRGVAEEEHRRRVRSLPLRGLRGLRGARAAGASGERTG